MTILNAIAYAFVAWAYITVLLVIAHGVWHNYQVWKMPADQRKKYMEELDDFRFWS